MSELDLSVNIAGVTFKNPVFTASGTFGAGREYADFIDINTLGAVTTKGVSIVPWEGNKPPRIAEVHGGMLNSIGLQNAGLEKFIQEDIPFLRQFGTKIIVNICGHTAEEYVSVARELYDADVDMLELNISCPNITEGGIAFGTDEKALYDVVYDVKSFARQPLSVKLSPNVTNISKMAKIAADAGADALSLINTIVGMKIDVHTRKPVLNNVYGGLSGAGIKPVAVRMVHQVRTAIPYIPIIGMGGISSGEDAVEFLLAGASAVSVGTANFENPRATSFILQGIRDYMTKYGFSSLNEIKLDE
ncbi:dihydroorotate dehydrogenase B (NAD(+)), catalytic subunit [Clostridia bacterium]|nr:dihydroorotate dehydrogenase B (NAD(+)), catalytic subunit [Clostridia bacterium]GHU74781.1 dihydroorotate dehydrogenase B (NAD(+)), catalytic subunit [Clostridia bacterium]